MLRARVLAALIGLLLATVLGAFFVVSGAVLHPLILSLNAERAEIAAYLVDQAEEASDAERRLRRSAQLMRVHVEIYDTLPVNRRRFRRAVTVQAGDREVIVFPGPQSPIVVQLQTPAGPRWAVMRFPVDLDQTPRRVGAGLLLLACAAVLVSWIITRWVLRPVELAGDGMARVAEGDLGHRLPANGDITGRIGRAFNQMADQVQGLVEGQRKMMAAVSHEVRTPLARLRLQAELLRDTGAPEGRLAAIEENIEEIDALIEELLESARLERGAIALHLGPVDLETLATSALAQIDLGQRPVTLDIEGGLCIVADERRLLRVSKNLLSNIARYTPPDAAVSIAARAAGTEADGIELVVADSGPGVSAEALGRLFDPFFRAEASRNKATGGLGLGLMLVRQIIEAHGGQIEAHNRATGGLAITIRLPAAPPAP